MVGKLFLCRGILKPRPFSGKNLSQKSHLLEQKETGNPDWKWKSGTKGANGAWELYDLDADRSELCQFGIGLFGKNQRNGRKAEIRWPKCMLKPWLWN